MRPIQEFFVDKKVDSLDKYQNVIVILLLLIFSAQVLYAIFSYSPTIDERPHINAGYKYLKTGEFDFEEKHPPLRTLQALPFLQGDFPLPKTFQDNPYGESFARILNQARIITLLFGILLGIFVFLWAKELFGLHAGLLALFLYSFEPNLIAYSSLATTDLSVTTFIFISSYFFYRFLQEASWKNAGFAGFFSGIALISKMTALLILPCFLITGVIYCWKKPKKRYLGLLFIILFATFFVINVAYLFKGTFKTSLHDLDFKVLRAAENYSLTDIPILLPSAYVKGINDAHRHVTRGHSVPAYLLGEFSWKGWWYYFFVAFFLKTPIPLILSILFSVIVLAKNFKREIIFIIVPVLILFTVASSNHLNIGLRHILPAYPFLIVMASSCVLLIQSQNRKVILCLLMTWLVFSTLMVSPQYLSYFNELIGDQKYAYKYLVDSSLEMGQSRKALDKYIENGGIPVKKSPGCAYTPGRVAISPISLVDLRDQNVSCHAWLRDIEPINRIDGIIIFDVPERTQDST